MAFKRSRVRSSPSPPKNSKSSDLEFFYSSCRAWYIITRSVYFVGLMIYNLLQGWRYVISAKLMIAQLCRDFLSTFKWIFFFFMVVIDFVFSICYANYVETIDLKSESWDYR